jgi:hypothetical protein
MLIRALPEIRQSVDYSYSFPILAAAILSVTTLSQWGFLVLFSSAGLWELSQ